MEMKETQQVRVRMEPSVELSAMIGCPYYIERSFSLNELREQGIINEQDIERMKAGHEIGKRIRVIREG